MNYSVGAQHAARRKLTAEPRESPLRSMAHESGATSVPARSRGRPLPPLVGTRRPGADVAAAGFGGVAEFSDTGCGAACATERSRLSSFAAYRRWSAMSSKRSRRRPVVGIDGNANAHGHMIPSIVACRRDARARDLGSRGFNASQDRLGPRAEQHAYELFTAIAREHVGGAKGAQQYAKPPIAARDRLRRVRACR